MVEIDPGITEVAREFFFLKDNPRLKIFHEDARVYLNKNTVKYDVIYGDAFTSWFSVPYQLTTREAIQKQYDSLSEDGIVIINIVSSLKGETSEFFRSEYFTFKDIFPQVYIFPTANKNDPKLMQNIILIALKSPKIPSFTSDDSTLASLLSDIWT